MSSPMASMGAAPPDTGMIGVGALPRFDSCAARASASSSRRSASTERSDWRANLVRKQLVNRLSWSSSSSAARCASSASDRATPPSASAPVDQRHNRPIPGSDIRPVECLDKRLRQARPDVSMMMSDAVPARAVVMPAGNHRRSAGTSVGKLYDVVSTSFGAIPAPSMPMSPNSLTISAPLAAGLSDDVADQRGFTRPKNPVITVAEYAAVPWIDLSRTPTSAVNTKGAEPSDPAPERCRPTGRMLHGREDQAFNDFTM